jgi:hypothetical protein
MRGRNSALAVALVMLGPAVATAQSAARQTPHTSPRHVASTADVQNLTVLRSASGRAVVRFGAGALETVVVGDRVGRTQAIVKRIAAGRMVLEEPFTGQDGRPNHALIVIADGQTGGTRYLSRSDQPTPPAVRRSIVVPKVDQKK